MSEKHGKRVPHWFAGCIGEALSLLYLVSSLQAEARVPNTGKMRCGNTFSKGLPYSSDLYLRWKRRR